MMADNSEEARARAEARFEKLQKTAAVWAQYEASRDAMRDRTASLKEMRLAKEAEAAETAAVAAAEKAAVLAAKKKRKVAVKA